MVEAARFYVKNSNLIRDPRKVEDVKAELLQSKGQGSRSERYLKDLGQKLSAFFDDFSGRPIRARARRTTVPEPAFLLDEGDAARGLQCVHREAAIAYTAAPAVET
jgi:hypothetical protein